MTNNDKLHILGFLCCTANRKLLNNGLVRSKYLGLVEFRWITGYVCSFIQSQSTERYKYPKHSPVCVALPRFNEVHRAYETLPKTSQNLTLRL